MFLIVGLGNPEDKYSKTRHNLGFEVVEKLAERIKPLELSWKIEEKFKSEILKTSLILNSNSLQLILAKPQTYMNLSGMAVSLLTTYYKLPATDVIVIHDDLDLPLGKIKIRIGGAAAGHHGVESIINSLGTDKFIRVRLGIGNLRTQSAKRGGEHLSAETFVLSKFSTSEKAAIKRMIKQAVKGIEVILEKGLEKAQNQFN